ncbi:MAG: LptF/LptG family permease [Pseudomonadota bacterium]
MPRLYSYILGQLIIATGLILSTLAIALWLTQSLRFLELAVNGGAGLTEFLALVLFTMPRFLTVLLPIAAGIGILFVYNKLLNDSELVVMRAVGISQWTLAQPALLLAFGITMILMALHTYAQPSAKWQFTQQQEELAAQFSDVLIRPGVFNSLGGDMTLYVRLREDRGELQGIVFQDARNPASPVVIMAERGVLREGPQGPQVIVYNGVRQEPTTVPGQLQQLSFDRYTIDLALFGQTEEEATPDIGERTIWQLWFPQEQVDQATRARYRAEAHSQLSQPLYGLAIPLAMLAIMLTGEFNRRGQARRVTFAIFTLIILEGGALSLSDAGMRGLGWVATMYGVPLISTCLAMLVLSGALNRFLSRRPPPPFDQSEPPADQGANGGPSGNHGPLRPALGPRPVYGPSV